MAFRQNNPLSRKTSPINKNWIKGAIKRPGAFKKKAEEAGMSTKAFAEKVTSNKDNYDARTGKQAELAETLMGMSRESFTMDELNETSKKQKIESKKQADKLPQIEFPGADYEMDQDMAYPGGERGRDYDEEGTKDGMSRKEAKYFGLGEDDGKARKIKKADKTAKQVVKMQNKRSSVKNVYLGDPDDLEGEMVRTADKPASKREKRKVKKLKKTKDQLDK